jgi:hypothetical protein
MKINEMFFALTHSLLSKSRERRIKNIYHKFSALSEKWKIEQENERAESGEAQEETVSEYDRDSSYILREREREKEKKKDETMDSSLSLALFSQCHSTTNRHGVRGVSSR